MQSYHINVGAGIAGLTIKEHDIPVPGPREVLVRVRANSLNQRELMVMKGTYSLPIRPDVVPIEEARIAHQYFAEHSQVGKVVISQS